MRALIVLIVLLAHLAICGLAAWTDYRARRELGFALTLFFGTACLFCLPVVSVMPILAVGCFDNLSHERKLANESGDRSRVRLWTIAFTATVIATIVLAVGVGIRYLLWQIA